MIFLRRWYVSFLKIHRAGAKGATAHAEHEGLWTAPYASRLYSWLDDRIEALEPTLPYCKKCGKETPEIHLWLCRSCFEEMDMAVEFDPEWDPKDL